MEGMMYPISLAILAVLAFFFNQTNNSFIVLVLVMAGVYIVYSHETGNTATDFKNEIIQEADKATGYE